MKVLVLGCNGQLGITLVNSAPDDIDLIGLDLPELDITNADALLECCREARPNVIINAAAYTAVDKAESEAELATAANVDGPRNIALAAQEIGARLIHISTDFVFDGASSIPYKTDADTRPLNVYGHTKRAGELAVLEETSGAAVVVRTSWLYSKEGSNFVKTMLRLMDERDELRVVADQTGTPTWSMSLVQAIWAIVHSPEHSGIFHWADGGETSWREFAVAIQEEALALGLLEDQVPIHPITTEDYPSVAKRPRYSVLDCSTTQAALNLKPEQWRSNLQKMLKGMTE
jgi:dTDP-4-dehydrorhamnose reductase